MVAKKLQRARFTCRHLRYALGGLQDMKKMAPEESSVSIATEAALKASKAMEEYLRELETQLEGQPGSL